MGFVFQTEKHGSGPIHVSAQLGNLVFELYPFAAGKVKTRYTLEVPSVKDVWDRLDQAPYALKRFINRVDSRTDGTPTSIHFTDPDGNGIEITERTALTIKIPTPSEVTQLTPNVDHLLLYKDTVVDLTTLTHEERRRIQKQNGVRPHTEPE